MWRFLAREGLTFIKNLHAGEQQRPDVAPERERWRRPAEHQSRRLVFVDETWAKTNTTRTLGCTPRGRHLIGRVPHRHWTTMTFLTELRSDRIEAPCWNRIGHLVKEYSPQSAQIISAMQGRIRFSAKRSRSNWPVFRAGYDAVHPRERGAHPLKRTTE
ncbi:MAG: hypothetical protein KGQ40_01000 [Rhodospirillales bacterium]|nr:hypothetical protein [Rhodospirillales bacterium]